MFYWCSIQTFMSIFQSITKIQLWPFGMLTFRFIEDVTRTVRSIKLLMFFVSSVCRLDAGVNAHQSLAYLHLILLPFTVIRCVPGKRYEVKGHTLCTHSFVIFCIRHTSLGVSATPWMFVQTIWFILDRAWIRWRPV